MVSCSQYDYIELACLFHLPVKLTMKSGEVYYGVAADTQRNSQKQECIALRGEEETWLLETDQLSSMEAL
ncbi:Rho-binding antiterminator, partial [Vibrio cholerae]